MIPQQLLKSTSVALPDILDARETRREIQLKIQEKYPYPLISFTLNMVGEYKVFPLSVATFRAGVSAIKTRCKAWGLPIRYEFLVEEYTGYECFLSVEADPIQIKKILCELEEQTTLGRLYDIDLITLEGEKISREQVGLPPRTCLLCEEEAFVCARSRRHSVDELWNHETKLMWAFLSQKYCEKVAFTATRGLLYEVSASPKPGLVDQNNTGAHRDMDIHTFEASALALLPFFQEFVAQGLAFGGRPWEDLPKLFPTLRPLGIQAELAMLEATHGVNTHKGIIFSMGIFLTVLGYFYGAHIPFSKEKLREGVSLFVSDLQKDFEKMNLTNPHSHGENLYVKYGKRGIRGEALEGYPSLFQVALPSLESLLKEGFSLNDSGVVTLLRILEVTEDSNVIHRSDFETMEEMQGKIRTFFGDMARSEEGLTAENALEFLRELDDIFIEKNISPGGSADLLALTYFLHFYQGEWEEYYGF